MRKYKSLTIRNPNKREEEGNRTENIIITRDILELDLFQDVSNLGMYIDLLRIANTRQVYYIWKEWGLLKICFLLSGQFSESLRFFENRWKISTRKVIGFFKKLQGLKLLEIVSPEDLKNHARTDFENIFLDSFKGNIKSGTIETVVYNIPFSFFLPENVKTIERNAKRNIEEAEKTTHEATLSKHETEHETQDNLQNIQDDLWD